MKVRMEADEAGGCQKIKCSGERMGGAGREAKRTRRGDVGRSCVNVSCVELRGEEHGIKRSVRRKVTRQLRSGQWLSAEAKEANAGNSVQVLLEVRRGAIDGHATNYGTSCLLELWPMA